MYGGKLTSSRPPALFGIFVGHYVESAVDGDRVTGGGYVETFAAVRKQEPAIVGALRSIVDRVFGQFEELVAAHTICLLAILVEADQHQGAVTADHKEAVVFDRHHQ